MKTITTELVPDGAKRSEGGRRLTAPKRMAELLAQYDTSGLSMAAFARREGLKYPTFACWVKKRGAQSAPAGERSTNLMRFAEVRLPGRTSVEPVGLSVTLPDGMVLRGTEPVGLAALARALMVRD